MVRIPRVSAQHARQIVREIAYASRARGRFFVLLITASMIASFGLIANSTAVIIGAMLVSPLMTPIFGAALGMLRGNPRLLGQSLWSEAIGVVLAVGAAYLVGLPQLSFIDATPEMLARTQPNLLDLFVAVFAGFAGAYALLDERVSPALPGVAIATAIVPPLSTCGLCLALGAWSGARGAMLLFLANFVSILLVALVTFWGGGLARTRRRSLGRVVAHFGPTLAAFAVVAIILTNSLTRIAHDRILEAGVYAGLDKQLALMPGADLEEMMHQRTARGVQVLATVRSQRTISPKMVTAIETALESSLNEPVDLVIRTIRSRDVSALGSSMQAIRPNLDGEFLVEAPDDFAAREVLASQVIREAFEREPGFELTRVEYGMSPHRESVIVAYVNAIRRLTKEEVVAVESQLQDRFEDPNMHFYIRVNAAPLLGRNGPIRIEWTNLRDAGPARADQLPEIEQAIRRAIVVVLEREPLRVHFRWTGKRWNALAEVIATGAITPQNVIQINEALPELVANRVEVLIWRHSDFVVTESGLTDYETLVEPYIGSQTEQLRGLFHTEVSPKQPSPAANDAESPAIRK